ncbi:sulfite exporter TauE/SafE family protein [Salmonella enterica subsp. enterica serovar Virchow]|nr:sulfite exporter TauE/SafE family protein [Salmonella enterica subsp. enterica serovar Virchow]
MFENFLPDGVSPTILALVCVSALVAGLARGFSGFGAALIFVPVASALVGPKLAVPVLLVIDATMALGMLRDGVRKSDLRSVAYMSAGAVIGVPAGAYVLGVADPIALRWSIVILIGALLALIMSGWRYRGAGSPGLTIIVGMISGLFSGAAQVGGPPVVAFWLGRGGDHRVMRANIVVYFAVSTALTVASYFYGGLFTRDVLALSLVAAPLYGVGLGVGSLAFGRTDEALFRRNCFALIALSALLGMPVWG